MPESGTSGSVGALGEKSPGATRPSKTAFPTPPGPFAAPDNVAQFLPIVMEAFISRERLRSRYGQGWRGRPEDPCAHQIADLSAGGARHGGHPFLNPLRPDVGGEQSV
jgi:hypothetical protein